MQIERRQLLRQQAILKGLNYYTGALDGIWGPNSIQAKKDFESTPEFVPGRPNNGLPFADAKPYPLGIVRNDDGLLYHICCEAKPLADEELKAAKSLNLLPAAVEPVVEAPKLRSTPPKVEVKEKKVEPTVTEEPKPSSE